MERRTRSRLTVGVILILLGIWFLALQIFPGLQAWAQVQLGWPLIIVAVGAILGLIGLLAGTPAMAIPACIVAGIGGILYWQNATGDWTSWSFAWALIPGFVGLGILLASVLGDRSQSASSGAWLILISLTLFAFFGSFLGGAALFGPYWPALLILLGIILLIRPVLNRTS